jgi:hypothetical protein
LSLFAPGSYLTALGSAMNVYSLWHSFLPSQGCFRVVRARQHAICLPVSAGRSCRAPPYAPSWPGVFCFRARFCTSKHRPHSGRSRWLGGDFGLSRPFPPGPLFNSPCSNSCVILPVVFLWRSELGMILPRLNLLLLWLGLTRLDWVYSCRTLPHLQPTSRQRCLVANNCRS